MKPKANPAAGARYLLEGAKLIRQPGLRAYALVPLIINFVIFSSAGYWAYGYFDGLVSQWMSYLPDWLDWLRYILWTLLTIMALLLVYYSFTIIANIIASPFNGFLAAKVEERLTGQAPKFHASIWQEVERTIRMEAQKLLYFLLWAIGLGLVSLICMFIGVLSPLPPVLWFLFGSWMMSIQYGDFAMANNGFNFTQEKQTLREQRATALGFGMATTVATMIPFVNFFVMPCAVAGGTAMWVAELRETEAAKTALGGL